MDSTRTIWVALDCPKPRALEIAEALGDHPAVRGFKLNRLIDAENFRAVGEKSLFKALTRYGKDLWADMKLHDIPETVSGRTEVYADSGWFKYLTVMARGDIPMMQAAVAAGAGKIQIIAVTELTSLSPKRVKDLSGLEPQASVLNLADMAVDAGVQCLVCSGLELPVVRATPKLTILDPFIPAISPAWTLGDQVDQKRTSTPEHVLLNGGKAMVIGRAIVKAENPLEALLKTVAEIEAIPLPA
jgi:orotidine-5'-phosphate decarboxylase